MADSVRHRIMAHLLERFRELRVSLDNTPFWSLVTDVPVSVSEEEFGKTFLGLFDINEVVVNTINCITTKNLEVEIEFSAVASEGSDRRKHLRDLLAAIEATMRSDINSGNLTLNIVELGNGLMVDGPQDRFIKGICTWEIMYRHQADDPTKLVGE